MESPESSPLAGRWAGAGPRGANGQEEERACARRSGGGAELGKSVLSIGPGAANPGSLRVWGKLFGSYQQRRYR